MGNLISLNLNHQIIIEKLVVLKLHFLKLKINLLINLMTQKKDLIIEVIYIVTQIMFNLVKNFQQ
jgi:hypothetical protein